MSDDDRFIGRLEDYLDAFGGETPLPTHLRDSIRAALPTTRQDRPRRGPGRVLTMGSGLSTPVRGGLIAAGLVVAVALGAVMVTGTSPGIGAGPTSTPVPSTAPTSSPAPSPSASAAGVVPLTQAPSVPCPDNAEAVSCIPAGTYALNPSTIPGEIVVTLPEGWFPFEPGAGAIGLLVDSGPDAPGGSGWGPMIAGVKDVRRDPCATDEAVFDQADVDTPTEVAAAMATWPGFAATEQMAITFAGVPGVQFDVSATDDLGPCPAPATWSTALGTWIDGYPMAAGSNSEPATFRVLDVGGELLIIRTPATVGLSPYESEQGVAPDPDRHVDDLVAMNAILDSMRFGEGETP